MNALTLQDAWLKRSFHGDDLTIRQLDIQSLAGKCTAKTGAAFYANPGGNSMLIGCGFCQCRYAVFGSGVIDSVGSFLKSFKD